MTWMQIVKLVLANKDVILELIKLFRSLDIATQKTVLGVIADAIPEPAVDADVLDHGVDAIEKLVQ
jgi:hypothetical protein